MKFIVIPLSLFIMSGCTKNEQETSTPPTEEVTENDNQEEVQEPMFDLNLDEDSSLTALVNKENYLSEDYVPEDLVMTDVPHVYASEEANLLREVAARQLEIMFEAAQSDGLTLYARSGYRSYQTQFGLYANYVNAHGQEAADRFSAKAGSSEHQTGLAMDITSEDVGLQLTEDFIDVPAGKWLSEHAHEYGFVMRYPEGKETITGYQFEPWHYRYFGEELATYLYENELTYEEFIETLEK